MATHPDMLIEGSLFLIIVLVVNRVETNIMVLKLFPDSRLESNTLFQGKRVGLGNHRNNIDDLAQFFHNDNVNRTELMARGVDKEQAAVNARVLNVSIAHGGKLFAEVRAVLVLDVLDNRVPAANPSWLRVTRKREMYLPSLIVDLVAVPGGINNVEFELDAILRNDYFRHLVRAARGHVGDTYHETRPGSPWSGGQVRRAQSGPWSR